MTTLPQTVQNLIDHFARLPGIGPKSASRIVLYLLNTRKENVENFAEVLKNIREHTKFCTICHNLADTDLCKICTDPKRSDKQIIVVEDVLDLLAFERAGDYQGKYHCLGGVISPMRGIGPDELHIHDLATRIKKLPAGVEVIIATNPNLEGEATAMYIKNSLGNLAGIKITRIARGLPSGADLDYADRNTLLGAFSGRTVL